MAHRGRHRLPFALAAATCALAALGAGASAQRFEPSDRETDLLSRAADGGFPNGGSRHPSISQDRQYASVAAFESDATDIVKGDANGATDVFAVHRKRPYSLNGEPWRPARTVLVSRSSSGAAANGPSFHPDVSGDREHTPRCVAFLSDATNLVKGDTNRRRDAFVHDLRSGRTTRVSLTQSNRQAAGNTTEVKIDGGCTRVAFVSEFSGRFQVYLRDLQRGKTTLASRSAGGRAGNGASYDVALTKRRNGGGPANAVAFTSEATNLHKGDRNGFRDVFVRRGNKLHLGSTTRSGKAGNGHSDQPALSDDGKYVAFRTASSDILSGDNSFFTDVARAVVGRNGTARWVSKSQAVNQPGNAPSSRPAMGAPGSPILFESDASNLQATVSSQFADRNQSGDVFYWNHVSFNVSLQSRDSDNEIPNLPTNRQRWYFHAPALNPVTSSIGNYTLFDAAWPLMDVPLAKAEMPQYDADRFEAAQASIGRPELRQVYLRYIGAR